MSGIATAVDITLNSLVLGGVFLIVAVGLNIIYGLSRVMNLAHGSLYAIGAYTGYTIVSLGVNFFAALLLAPVIVGIVGLIIERIMIAPMRKRSMIYTLILTYGLMFFLDGLIKYSWGNEPPVCRDSCLYARDPVDFRHPLPGLPPGHPGNYCRSHDRPDALFK
jgi:branched-subunit amino acid ABC-type transport system permease component